MNPRYFIGITLPDGLSKKIESLQQEFLQPGKVMFPLKPHITLLHPNLLETAAPSHFIPKIKNIAKKDLPIKIDLTGTNMFDERVLYLDVSSKNLIKLQNDLASILPDRIRGQYLIGRSYKPHVTIVQAKPKQNLPPELIAGLKAKINPMLPVSFTTTQITQFTWLRPRTYKINEI